MSTTLAGDATAAELDSQIGLDEAKDVASTFHILSDASRIRILHYLAGSERPNVAELARFIGYSQPACSYHLSLLSAGKLIQFDRKGKQSYYRLTDLGRRAIEVANLLRG
jgi:DNA-binding transcriptional ArsR family regulator